MTDLRSTLENYVVLKLLSIGTHSKIKLVKCRSQDKFYVAHIFKIPEFFQFFDKEVQILQTVTLENTIRLIDSNPSGNYVKKTGGEYFCKYFIVDFIESGNLCDLTDGLAPLSDQSVKYLFRSILQVVQELHMSDYCHRTISAKNILFTESLQPKLSGLTYCERISDSLHTQIYSKKYLALEITKTDAYNGALSDIFSLGVVLFYLKTLRLPFFSVCPTDLHMRNFIKDKGSFWKNFDRKNLLSEEVKDLIEKMIEPNIEKRICLDDVLRHSWLTSDVANAEEVKMEIETRREELINKGKIKRQELRIIEGYREYEIESGSIDIIKAKDAHCLKFFRSNIVYSTLKLKELLGFVSLHGLKCNFSLVQSQEFLQVKAVADVYQDTLKYKAFVYEADEFNALELKFEEGNYFDFCEVMREVRKMVYSASN